MDFAIGTFGTAVKAICQTGSTLTDLREVEFLAEHWGGKNLRADKGK